ncbi:MAG TPA: MJ1477/TM1410 family putative glycoside hydrolase [Phycisphaerae bacterium]
MRWRLKYLMASLAFLSGCAQPGNSRDADGENRNAFNFNSAGERPAISNERLRAVNDWAYQLQGDPAIDLEALGRTPFDLVVIDYSRDGRENGAFSTGEITGLKSSSGGAKIVLAYMSIGEAEIGRFYFNNAWIRPDPNVNPDGPFTLTSSAPSFLAAPNPNFPDNFKVRYWEPRWQQIIIHNPGGHPDISDSAAYLDRILAAGFDGVYLDIIDAFEFFADERDSAAADMVTFVAAIADYARAQRPDFIVVPQNGSGIIAEVATDARARYFAAINGIGAEDTFYFGDADENNPFNPQTATVEFLREFRQAGLTVLAIDYLAQRAAIDDFYARARAEGWVPYASVRALDRPIVNPSQPPD